MENLTEQKPEQAQPAQTKPKRWWLWIVIPIGSIIGIFIILMIIGAVITSKEVKMMPTGPNYTNVSQSDDISNSLDLSNQADAMKPFCEDFITKIKANDVTELETLLSTSYKEKYKNENFKEYIKNYSDIFQTAKFDENPFVTVSKDPKTNEPQILFRKKFTAGTVPSIFSLVVIKENGQNKVADIGIQVDKNPDAWEN